mgnify:CR=1 FL=1
MADSILKDIKKTSSSQINLIVGKKGFQRVKNKRKAIVSLRFTVDEIDRIDKLLSNPNFDLLEVPKSTFMRDAVMLIVQEMESILKDK